MPHRVEDETTAPTQQTENAAPAQFVGAPASPHLASLFGEIIHNLLVDYKRCSKSDDDNRRPSTIEIQPDPTILTLLHQYDSPGADTATANIQIRVENSPFESPVTLLGTNLNSRRRNRLAKPMFNTNRRNLRRAAHGLQQDVLIINSGSLDNASDPAYINLVFEQAVNLLVALTGTRRQYITFVAIFSFQVRTQVVQELEREPNDGEPATNGDTNGGSGIRIWNDEYSDSEEDSDTTDDDVDDDTTNGVNGNHGNVNGLEVLD